MSCWCADLCADCYNRLIGVLSGMLIGALIGALVDGLPLFGALICALHFLAGFKSCTYFVLGHTSSKVKAVF